MVRFKTGRVLQFQKKDTFPLTMCEAAIESDSSVMFAQSGLNIVAICEGSGVDSFFPAMQAWERMIPPLLSGVLLSIFIFFLPYLLVHRTHSCSFLMASGGLLGQGEKRQPPGEEGVRACTVDLSHARHYHRTPGKASCTQSKALATIR